MGTDLLRLPRGTHGALGMKLHQHGVEEAVPPTGPTGATTVRNTSHNHRSKASLTGQLFMLDRHIDLGGFVVKSRWCHF